MGGQVPRPLFLTRPSDARIVGTEFINAGLIKEYLPAAAVATKTLLYGLRSTVHAVGQFLIGLGFKAPVCHAEDPDPVSGPESGVAA